MASNLPPMPTSSTAQSTPAGGDPEKYISPRAVSISKKVGESLISLFLSPSYPLDLPGELSL
ncbi:MAG: hypothetical protein AAB260_02085, partial [Planctomycetota bacterium]